MNFYPNEEVRDALKILSLPQVLVSKQESLTILKNVLTKFTTEKNYSFPLWDKLIDSTSVQYEYAWALFFKIFKNEEVILFFEFDDDQTMFLFEDGSILTKVFENCFRFEFYITDKENSFLVASNDHDYLIGCGRAITWIENIKANKY